MARLDFNEICVKLVGFKEQKKIICFLQTRYTQSAFCHCANTALLEILTNKLECLSLASFSSQVQYLLVSQEHSTFTSLWVGPWVYAEILDQGPVL